LDTSRSESLTNWLTEISAWTGFFEMVLLEVVLSKMNEVFSVFYYVWILWLRIDMSLEMVLSN